MSNPAALIKELEKLVQAGNTEKGQQVLSQLKIALLQKPDPAQTVAALELGVLLSVASGDLEAFARNMAQLQPSYYASGDGGQQSSPRKAHITGLNLMHLLVENRLSEFHSELEWLTEAEAADPYVAFPIQLERELMVGLYDEILQKPVPDATYQFFMDHLSQTVRDAIADCMEVSYATLKLQDAAAMMKFESLEELQTYIRDVRDDWIVEGDHLTFSVSDSAAPATADDIPSLQWIQQSLTYATEMERIV